MAIRIALHHKTSYRYDRLVSLSPHEVRLRPAPHARTPILSYSLTVLPQDHFINWQQDPYGNYIGRFVFPEKSDTLEFTVDLVADMTVINPFDFFVEKYAESFPLRLPRATDVGTERLPAGRAARPPADRMGGGGAPRPAGQADGDQRLPGGHQPAPAGRHRLPAADGARRPGAGRNAGEALRLLPRQRLAAGADPARDGTGGALRVRLPDPAARRPGSARRPQRRGRRLYRPACVDRGLRPRRRLDRARPHLGHAGQRRPYSARLHGDALVGGAGVGLYRQGRGHLLPRNDGHPHPRRSARDQALHGAKTGRRSTASASRSMPT
jgi:hypothetical protein